MSLSIFMKQIALVSYLFGVYLVLRSVSSGKVSTKSRLSNISSGNVRSAKESARVSALFSRLNNIPYVRFCNKLVMAQNFSTGTQYDLCVLSILLCLVIGVAVTSSYTLIVRLLYIIGITHIPHVVLYIKLVRQQANGSMEAETFLNELYSQYKICNGNILSALDMTMVTCRDMHILRKPVLKLCVSLKQSAGIKDVKSVLNMFEYSVGTLWSKKLTNIILTSLTVGSDQSKALEDLIEDLTYGRRLYERDKRSNSDTVILIKNVIPLTYIGVVAISFLFFKVSIIDFIRNQFGNSIGRGLFICLVIMQCFNLVILYYLENKKLDVLK